MNCQQLRVIYAGTPEFAVPALKALHESEHSVVAVYTQPDRPAGRGRKLMASAVKQYALSQSLEVVQPTTLRTDDCQVKLQSFDADVMVVAAYGMLLPVEILAIPRLGCINIHGSLLPRWRGAAPIQRAILAGDQTTGITIMQMAKGLDTGDMLLKQTIVIEPNMTAGEIHDRLSELGAATLARTLSQLCEKKLVAEVQNDADACYAEKLQKHEAKLDWSQSAETIHRQVCAFNPWPITYCDYAGKSLRIWRSRIATIDIKDAVPGQVLAAEGDAVTVACGNGAIDLLQLQMPGKKAIPAKQFLNGRDVLGQCFG